MWKRSILLPKHEVKIMKGERNISSLLFKLKGSNGGDKKEKFLVIKESVWNRFILCLAKYAGKIELRVEWGGKYVGRVFYPLIIIKFFGVCVFTLVLV